MRLGGASTGSSRGAVATMTTILSLLSLSSSSMASAVRLWAPVVRDGSGEGRLTGFPGLSFISFISPRLPLFSLIHLLPLLLLLSLLPHPRGVHESVNRQALVIARATIEVMVDQGDAGW